MICDQTRRELRCPDCGTAAEICVDLGMFVKRVQLYCPECGKQTDMHTFDLAAPSMDDDGEVSWRMVSEAEAVRLALGEWNEEV